MSAGLVGFVLPAQGPTAGLAVRRAPAATTIDQRPAAAAAQPPPASHPAGYAALLAGGAAAVAGAGRRRRQRQRAAAVGRHAERQSAFGDKYKEEFWTTRVKFLEGDRAIFDVTIPKPLGLIPQDYPNRPGVGVSKITPDGNTDLLNRSVIIDGAPGMWVLEGDEVVAVNGARCEGKGLDTIGPMVKESAGDSVTLTLVRYCKAGPVKVCFLPSGSTVVMKRGVEIAQAAKLGVQEVSYSCKEGWCKACWHTDPMFGIVYRACSSIPRKRPPPKNPREIPKLWNSVVPLWLLARQDAQELIKQVKEQEAKAPETA